MLPSGARTGIDDDDDDKEGNAMRRGRLLDGRIRVRYGVVADGDDAGKDGDDDGEVEGSRKDAVASPSSSSSSSSGIEMEVDARAYVYEIRREVKRLRDELEATKLAKEEELRKDLLAYIRSLPRDELRRLTGTMSSEVLDAMKGLVSAVLSGIGEEGGGEEEEEENEGRRRAGGNGDNIIGPNTVTEQSGEALAQLCMWQLVVGYNLRELEVREEFRASMAGSDGNGGGGAGGAAAGGDGSDGWR